MVASGSRTMIAGDLADVGIGKLEILRLTGREAAEQACASSRTDPRVSGPRDSANRLFAIVPRPRLA
jgi:hypothetical protein